MASFLTILRTKRLISFHIKMCKFQPVVFPKPIHLADRKTPETNKQNPVKCPFFGTRHKTIHKKPWPIQNTLQKEILMNEVMSYLLGEKKQLSNHKCTIKITTQTKKASSIYTQTDILPQPTEMTGGCSTENTQLQTSVITTWLCLHGMHWLEFTRTDEHHCVYNEARTWRVMRHTQTQLYPMNNHKLHNVWWQPPQKRFISKEREIKVLKKKSYSKEFMSFLNHHSKKMGN